MNLRMFKEYVSNLSVDECRCLHAETRHNIMSLWALRPPMPKKLRGPLATQLKMLSKQVHIISNHLHYYSSAYRERERARLDGLNAERRRRFELDMARISGEGIMPTSGLVL